MPSDRYAASNRWTDCFADRTSPLAAAVIIVHAICPPTGAIADLLDEITRRLADSEDVVVLTREPSGLENVDRRRRITFGRRAGLLAPRLIAQMRLLARSDPELVLLWTQHPLAAIPMVVFRRSRRVAWWHEPVGRGQVGRVKQFAYRLHEVLVIRRAEVIVVSSDTVARSVPERYQPRLRVVPFPALSSFEHPSARFASDPTDLIFFGVIAPHKGLDVLAAALTRLRDEGLTPTLRIAGPGDLRESAPSMHGYAEMFPAQVRVVPGYLDSADLAAAIVASSIVVLPYLSAAGSTTTSIAHGLGRPVLASAVGAFSDEITPDRDGWLVPPGDPDALAEGIRLALDRGLVIDTDDTVGATTWATAFLNEVLA